MSLLKNVPENHKIIFSEANYSDIKTISELESFLSENVNSELIPNLNFLIEEKLPGYRPDNKFYIGGEILFIIKYIEPRISPQHDLVRDKEFCVLRPDYFLPEEINSLLEKIKNFK